MKNLVKMMTVVAVIVVMVMAFTGCGSQKVDITGTYTVDDCWGIVGNEYAHEYAQCATHEEARTLAKQLGVDTIMFTDSKVYFANGEECSYTISEAELDGTYTILCSNGYKITYYADTATIAYNYAYYDFWYFAPITK